MKCPFCAYVESKVVDSRPTDEGKSIRRRRECLSCQRRFTTYEVVESLPVMVVKKNGTRQPFERDKLVAGLLRACVNRPVSVAEINQMADSIEARVQNSLEREVTSDSIGQFALDELKQRDEVAYVRFASVTNRFSDIDSFMELLQDLKKER